MEGSWTVTYDGKPIGHCKVQKAGLYYHFSSCCKSLSNQICRLHLRCDEKVVDLGIFVPQEGCLVLEKRLAIKNIPDGRPEFLLNVAGQSKRVEENFVPVCDDMPLPCLQKLHYARFAVRGGVPGIVIKDEGCA